MWSQETDQQHKAIVGCHSIKPCHRYLIEGHRYGKNEYDRKRMKKKTRILLFTQRTYTYTGKIDNEQQLRIAITRLIEVNI
jgi:hypothetical protein